MISSISLSVQLQGSQLLLHTPPDVRVRFWLDLVRFEPLAAVALLVRAQYALCTIRGARGELRAALVAFIMRYRLGTELIAGVAVWVFILFGPMGC